jgi:hypothetical protein
MRLARRRSRIIAAVIPQRQMSRSSRLRRIPGANFQESSLTWKRLAFISKRGSVLRAT